MDEFVILNSLAARDGRVVAVAAVCVVCGGQYLNGPGRGGSPALSEVAYDRVNAGG